MSLNIQVSFLFLCLWAVAFIPSTILVVIYVLLIISIYHQRLSKVVLAIWVCFVIVLLIVLNPKVPPETGQVLCGSIISKQPEFVSFKSKQFTYTIFDTTAFNLLDKVCLEGSLSPNKTRSNFHQDPIENFVLRANIAGVLKVSKINEITRSNHLKTRIFQQLTAANHQLLLSLFYGWPTPLQSSIASLLIVSAMVYQSLFALIKTILRFFFFEKTTNWIMLCFLLLIALFWSTSFIWWRIALTSLMPSFFKDRKSAPILGYAVCLLLFPNFYNHLSFVLPILFSYLHKTKLLTGLNRFFMMLIIQQATFYTSNLLFTIFYPIIKIIITTMVAHGLLVLPFQTYHQSFETIWYKLNQFHVHDFMFAFLIRGKLSVWVLLIALIVLIYQHHALNNKKLQLFFCWSLPLLSLLCNPFSQTTFFNVGQGDAALIQLPFKQGNIMIDVARASNYPMLKRSLFAKGIKRLDAIILSHLDSDHAGGLDKFFNDFKVAQVIIDKKDIIVSSLEVVALLKDYQGNHENDNSVLSYFNLSGLSYLFLGDLYQSGEQELVRNYPKLPVDIIKIAHHGSKTSSDPVLFSNYQPVLAIISADPTLYNHPSDITLKNLSDFRIHTLFTYRDGDILVLSLKDIHFLATSNHLFGIIKTVKP